VLAFAVHDAVGALPQARAAVRPFPLSHAAGRVGASTAASGQQVDLSSTVVLIRHSLAQAVLSNTGALRALLGALSKQEPVRDAALLVLMHCCRQYPLLSMACIRAGLINTLMRLVPAPGLPDIMKVRTQAVPCTR
jgi:hypothetical protein